MTLPSTNHPKWEEVISGKSNPKLEFLGTKLLLGRLARTYKSSPTPETMKACIVELESFFYKNQAIPKAQSDLDRIFN